MKNKGGPFFAGPALISSATIRSKPAFMSRSIRRASSHARRRRPGSSGRFGGRPNTGVTCTLPAPASSTSSRSTGASYSPSRRFASRLHASRSAASRSGSRAVTPSMRMPGSHRYEDTAFGGSGTGGGGTSGPPPRPPAGSNVPATPFGRPFALCARPFASIVMIVPFPSRRGRVLCPSGDACHGA